MRLGPAVARLPMPRVAGDRGAAGHDGLRGRAAIPRSARASSPYRRAAARARRRRQPLKLGYAYRRIRHFGMPYWVEGEYGLVTYLGPPRASRSRRSPPGNDRCSRRRRAAGRAVLSFRWTPDWGWFFPLLSVWILLWRREDRREEEARWECMSARLVLHEYARSGNCYKIRLTAALLGLPLERREYDIMKGETRTPEFLATSTPTAASRCCRSVSGSSREQRRLLLPRRRHRAGPRGPVRPRRHAALDVLGAI